MDWKNKFYPAGSEVFVMDIHSKPLGKGVMLYDYDLDSEDNAHPEIRLRNGEIILGCECWWIPVAEVDHPEASKYIKEFKDVKDVP